MESSEIDLSEFQEENQNAGAAGGGGNDNNGDANDARGDGNDNRDANDGKLLLTNFPLNILTWLSLVMHWLIIQQEIKQMDLTPRERDKLTEKMVRCPYPIYLEIIYW